MRWFRTPAEDGPGPLVRAARHSRQLGQAEREVLGACDELLHGTDPTVVVVLAGQGALATELGPLTARAFPAAEVLVLTTEAARPTGPGATVERVTTRSCRNVRGAHAALLEVSAPDVLLDAGGCPASLRFGVFQHLFAALRDGGRYLLLDGGETADPALQDREGESLPQLLDRLRGLDPARLDGAHPDDAERARMLGGWSVAGPVVLLRKRGNHLAKVREEEADRVVPARLGRDRSGVLLSRPGSTFRSRATLVSNAPELDEKLLPVFEVPARTVRVVRDVVCLPRQAALADDLLLPASFHQPTKSRLRNRSTVDAARWYARLAAEPHELPVLEGTWYHLASEFPGHFGHAMTEGLARLWGLDRAREADDDLRVLYGAGDGEPPGWWRDLLGAYGVAADDVGAPGTPVRVERLVTATPRLQNPRYVDPGLAEDWERVCAGVATDGGGPRRIFVTRPPGLARRCRNGARVEERFAEAGFVVVSPETLSIADQLALFAGADAVAGYAGSGLFSAIATAPGATMIVIASESYTAANEWLISSVKGFRHHQLWCPSDRPRAQGSFDRRAFHADYAFDFERDGRALDAALASCAG